ncbi:MAG TPA: GNAT family N-acetyltransferase, partial [Bacteroidia bacterium]|nr:GNAT family N-acetyltransferase [Bacteroidia bacterium]
MLQLVDDVFSTRSDPSQLQVDEDVLRKLGEIHPATLSDYDDGEGPAVWILVIPTTEKTMRLFLDGAIPENELLARTSPGEKFEAIYLCSATVLPEFRKKGLARKLTVEAIENIRKDHGIRFLYVWPFTPEGDRLAEKIAAITGLPLLKKISGHARH